MVKTYKRKTYKRKGRSNRDKLLGKINPISLGPALPQKMRIKWQQQSQYTMGAGTIADDVIQLYANSGYDFYGSGGSEKPPTYDLFQNANSYLRHRVLGIKVKASFINLGTKATRVCVYLSDQALDMSNIASYNLNNSQFLHQEIVTPSGGSRDMVTINKYFDFVKLYGNKVLLDDTYQCPYNSVSGLDIIYLYIVAQTCDATTTCNVLTTIDAMQYTDLEDLSIAEASLPN